MLIFGIGSLLGLVVLGTSIWATADAHLLRQRGFEIEHPAAVLIACLALWIVIFPWYLVKRELVQNKLVETSGYVSSVPRSESESVSERLKNLEALYTEGLVSQQEYNDKRKEIVSSL